MFVYCSSHNIMISFSLSLSLSLSLFPSLPCFCLQCTENNPCFGEQCIDLEYGFICPPCPAGYTGGVYRGFDASVKQVQYIVTVVNSSYCID